ncbi:hypothetical protein DA075_13450 [Methylobacterium currus]|uniref:Uncharacterized protein n=1 Tax=Methylobacterium currus TaxID=2051553 RepID=A0A2R4WJT2_9HYPH|nr:hypothetical protein [Methylobacterium currus]AWB21801.1 hypothetical protein DA075_13450 [Methylobacterium currus]
MGDDFSPEEFGAACRSLSRDDRKKLGAIAKRLCGGTTLNPDDLLNEAICRTLLGTRQCDRELNVVAYLAGVMRSLASHERDKQNRSVSTDDAEKVDAHMRARLGGMPKAGSAEDAIIDAQERARIIEEVFEMFRDQPKELAVLEALRDELAGKALRERTGLAQGDLDYAKKRIRNALSLRYPKGWRS